ncbi:alpha/beta hydrolase [Priestia koreensis]|uniref:alpha/beta hydrolase n=1 Tax=Priestia koreensis TaxID=284581 RepID=UPI003CFE37DB
MSKQLAYKDGVDWLKNTSSQGEFGDVSFWEKPIPDTKKSGELDPRVYEMKQKERAAREGKKEESAEDVSIEAIRESMGFPNTDVTTSAIQVHYTFARGRSGDIPIRIYTPPQEEKKPAVVYFHGGGFIGGSVDVVENACKCLAERAGAVVINVDYRLAPEHPFPAGLHDCYDVVLWVHEHADKLGIHSGAISVAGDSAGGNLANGCSVLDRNSGKSIIQFQALIYPVVLLDRKNDQLFQWDVRHYEIQNEEHRDLILADLIGMESGGELLSRLYCRDYPVTDTLLSPLLAERLESLPDTLIVTAEYDYLRLEAEEYAKRLTKAGVSSSVIRYKGMDHAFIDKMGVYPQAEDCMEEIAKVVRSIGSVRK